MTFQYIIHHLDKPHSWFIVLTNPHTELNTKKKLEQQGFITYVPLVSVRRCWEGCIKEIHIPAIARCVFVERTYRLSGHCFRSFHYARVVFWTVACR